MGFSLDSAIPLLTNISKDALVASVPALDSFSIGVSTEPTYKGKTSRVNLYGDPGTATEYDRATNNYTTGSDPDMDGIDVPLTNLPKITKIITAYHMQNGLELQKLANGVIRKLVRGVSLNAMGVVTNANFSQKKVVGAASAVTADTFVDLAGDAADLGWDEANFRALLSTGYYGALAKDDALGTASAQDQAMRTTGRVRDLSGFLVQRFSGLPTNSENLVGFITDTSGIAIASAPNASAPEVEKKLDLFQVISVPGALTITMRGIANVATNELAVTWECLNGVRKARSAGLIRLVSA